MTTARSLFPHLFSDKDIFSALHREIDRVFDEFAEGRAAVLALIVVIRVMHSLTLHFEIEGR